MDTDQSIVKNEAAAGELSKSADIQAVHKEKYYYSFDSLRVICLLMLIFACFNLPVLSNLLRPYLNAATGILYALYGYLVLRDGANLRKNIKHTAKVFAITFAVYGLMTMGYLLLLYGQPFAYFNKRSIFNFVVLNYWEETFCSSIWYVQSTLYALIILWLLRRFKRYDWVLCLVLFIISVLIGELAELTGIKFQPYNYIPGNFFTRTIPYMLLGRLIRQNSAKIQKLGSKAGVILLIVGIVLSVLEFFALLFIGKLSYANHLIGFIFIAAGALLIAVKRSEGSDKNIISVYARRMYKPMYFIFNPVGYVIVLAIGLLCRTKTQYTFFEPFVGLLVAAVTLGICYLRARVYLKKHPEELKAEKKVIIMSKRKKSFISAIESKADLSSVEILNDEEEKTSSPELGNIDLTVESSKKDISMLENIDINVEKKEVDLSKIGELDTKSVHTLKKENRR